jgi:hypothetical protein
MGQLKPSLVGMFIGSFLCSYFMNSVSGVNVSAVDLGLNPSPIKPIKGYIIGNCYFFAQNAAFRKSSGWLGNRIMWTRGADCCLET